MLIVRKARVRYLVIGAVGELVIFNEHMIGKRSTNRQRNDSDDMTVGDKVELANVMTIARVREC